MDIYGYMDIYIYIRNFKIIGLSFLNKNKTFKNEVKNKQSKEG